WPPPPWGWSGRAAARSSARSRWSGPTCPANGQPRPSGACPGLLVGGQVRVGGHGQQAVDLLHVGDVQGSGGLGQQQPALQETVAGQRQVALGVEQVLLVD